MMPSPSNTHLISVLRDHAAQLAGEIFCSFQNGKTVQEISFGRLLSRAGGYSQYFQSLGLRRGDPVFIILRHRPDLLYAFIGALLAGCIPAILAPISEKQSPEVYWATLRSLFGNVGAAAVVVEPDEDGAVAEVGGRLRRRG